MTARGSIEVAEFASRLTSLASSTSLSSVSMNSTDLEPFVACALREIIASGPAIRDVYYQDLTLAKVVDHGDLLANLLARIAGLMRATGAVESANLIAGINKSLHGIDFFAQAPSPKYFKLVHPVGTVIGRTALPDFSVVYQGVSIGGKAEDPQSGLYPMFSGPVVFFAGSSVFGASRVGSNVVFGANAMVIGQEIPDGSLVVGQYPRHRILSGASDIIERFFDFNIAP